MCLCTRNIRPSIREKAEWCLCGEKNRTKTDNDERERGTMVVVEL